MHTYTVQLRWPDEHFTEVHITARNIYQAAADAQQLYSVLAQQVAEVVTVKRVREDWYTSGKYELLGPL